MNLRLHDLPPAAYAERVLPLTHALWGHGRSFETYVEQTAQLAATTYGKRSYRTVALTGGAEPLASFKRYDRLARCGSEPLRAMGIGAVFTPPEHRGCGYASAMLAMALDAARAEGIDFAYLFSDIHPQFYKTLGFAELASRSISLRADALAGDRVQCGAIAKTDWTGIRKCFDSMQARSEFALTRSPAMWDWMRMRLEYGSERSGGQPVWLAVHSGKNIAAYVIGQREPKHDAYVLEELGFANEGDGTLIPALLRTAAGDLRRVTGWLPPEPARGLLPRGSVKRRDSAVWMAAPLSDGGARFVRAASAPASADGVWALDHI